MRTIAPLQQQTVTSLIQNKQASPDTHRLSAGQGSAPLTYRLSDRDDRNFGQTDQPAGTVVYQPRQHGAAIIHHELSDVCLLIFIFIVFGCSFYFNKHQGDEVPVKEDNLIQSLCRCSFLKTTMTLEDMLTTAAARGSTECVEELLQHGAQVNGVNRFGRTALQVSVARRSSTSSASQQRRFTFHLNASHQLGASKMTTSSLNM